jgi:arsenite methyltransferase
MREFFGSREWILDAGCGAGFATSAWMDESWSGGGAQWVGCDISAAIDVARERLGSFPDTHFVQADVSRPPFRADSFDVVFAEGVLHHTPSTRAAFDALVPLLAPGGELMIYVYRRKSPIREFTDDLVRERIAGMSPEEAWEALRPLTRLGQALAELGVEVEVPEDVPLLEIEAGRYDVQRLVYWHVAKLFWNPALTFEENVHLNFDWYAPRYAHRHTEEEVRGWYAEAGLEVTRFDVHEAGFTVRGVDPA